MLMLKIGTDCSGIDAPIFALRLLGVKYHHAFSSDIDKDCRCVIKANSNPDELYHNMQGRDMQQMPRVDIYVCGFPCQPFSNMNCQKTSSDKRRTVFESVFEYIESKRPSIFILENVRNLLSMDDGRIFERIMKDLNSLDYNITHSVLNSKNFGVPHSRTRLWIVGIRQCKQRVKFQWPTYIACKVAAIDLIEPVYNDDLSKEVSQYYVKALIRMNVPRTHIGLIEFCQLTMRKRPHTKGNCDVTKDELEKLCPRTICPCLVRHDPGIYVNHLHRYITGREALSLQGFPKSFKYPNSSNEWNKKIRKMCGNSMTVHVLASIMSSALKSIGHVGGKPVTAMNMST